MTNSYAARLASFREAHPRLVECTVRAPTWTGSRIPANGNSCDCCGTHRLKWLWPITDMRGKVYFIGEECWKNLKEAGILKVLKREEEGSFPLSPELQPPIWGRPTYLYQEAKP